jgi:hypothetical protein
MISIVDPFCPRWFGIGKNHHVAAGPGAALPMPIRYLIFILGRRAWGRWGGFGLPGWAISGGFGCRAGGFRAGLADQS